MTATMNGVPMPDPGKMTEFSSGLPSITLDGKEIKQFSEGLIRLLVEETCEGIYRSEISIENMRNSDRKSGALHVDREILDFGKQLCIRVGAGASAIPVFNGSIMGWEAIYTSTRSPEILVLAEDSMQEFRLTRKKRFFEKITDRQVIETIAEEYQLHTLIDIEGPTYPVLAQANQSDLAFLRERVRSIDAELWIADGTLHAQSRTNRRKENFTLTFPYELKEFRVAADLSNQCTSLTVGGWDVSNKEKIECSADDSVIKNELKGSESGSSILAKVLGKKVDRFIHIVPSNPIEGKCNAEAQYRQKARKFINGRGFIIGDGRLRAGIFIRLEGLGDIFNGLYYVTEVRHTFDLKNGYRTYFSVERPGL